MGWLRKPHDVDSPGMTFKDVVEQLCEELKYEVYDMLASIRDPEFPDKTLGDLKTTVQDTTNVSLYGSAVDKMVINEADIFVKLLGYDPYDDDLYISDEESTRSKQPKTDAAHVKAARKARFNIQVKIYYTPTVAHCTLTSLIGLCIYQKLTKNLPIVAHTQLFNIQLGFPEDEQDTISRFFTRMYRNTDSTSEDNLNIVYQILITPGSHSTEMESNRQIADKERVLAALESSYLLKTINNLID